MNTDDRPHAGERAEDPLGCLVARVNRAPWNSHVKNLMRTLLEWRRYLQANRPVWPSMGLLAEALSVSESTAREYVNEAVACGALEPLTGRKGGRSKATRYLTRIPPLSAYRKGPGFPRQTHRKTALNPPDSGPEQGRNYGMNKQQAERLLVLGSGGGGSGVASAPPGDARREARIRALRAAGLTPRSIPDLADADDLPASRITEIAERIKAGGGHGGAIVNALRDWLGSHRAKPKPVALPGPEPTPEPKAEPEPPPVDLSAIPPAELERLADGFRAAFSQHRAKPTPEILALPRFALWVEAERERRGA